MCYALSAFIGAWVFRLHWVMVRPALPTFAAVTNRSRCYDRVVVNSDTVIAAVGNNFKVNADGYENHTDAAGNVQIGASSKQDHVFIFIGAGYADKTDVAGIIGVVVSDSQIQAGLGNDVIINAAGDVAVNAANEINFTGILGGLTSKKILHLEQQQAF